jgi:hypothetical protein
LEHGFDDVLEGLVVESGFSDERHECLEGWEGRHQGFDVFQGLEADKGFEVGECEGDFGFVVGVREVGGIPGMEFSG